MAAALEALPLPALIVTREGRLQHANTLGRSRFDHSKSVVREAREAIAGKIDSMFRVTPLTGRGMPPCFLLVEHRAAADVRGRAAQSRLAWKLTPRETEVLALLAAGEPTKIIADRLGCAMRTVEAHATQVFRKAGVDGRPALLVRFWSS